MAEDVYYENLLNTTVVAALLNPKINLEISCLGLILLNIIYLAVLENILLM